MLTQEERDYGFTEEDLEYSMDTFQEAMEVSALYDQFIQPEVINNQTSWTKWHIMERKQVTYTVAERLLKRAVSEGKLKDEDYYGRFVVIK